MKNKFLQKVVTSLLAFSLTAQPALAQLKFRVPLEAMPLQSGVLVLNESDVDFGAVPINQRATRELELTNSGTQSVALETPKVEGEGFYSSSTCGTYLAPSAKCTITVGLLPSDDIAYSGKLTVRGDEGRSTLVANLSGRGEPGSLSLTPSSVTFTEPLQVGDAAEVQYVNVRNTGAAPVSGIAISAVNPQGAADFTQSNNCGAELGVDQSCRISVGFTPMAPGARNALLAVTSNASNGVQTAPLSGAGVAPSGSLSIAAFGNVQLGSSRTAEAIFTNTGRGTLSVQAIGISAGDFSLVSHDCPNSIAANGTCKLTVSFSPTEEGVRSGQLGVKTAEAGDVVTALSGSGQAPGASPTTPSFTATRVGQEQQVQATLTNTGIDALSVSVPTTTSVTGESFRFVSTTCAASLPAGQSCVVSVAFAPTSMGDKTGQLTVATGAGQRAASLTALATDITFSVDPGSVAFGNVPVGSPATLPLTVRNTGNLPLRGLSAAVSAPFSVAPGTCGEALAAGASCVMNVSFSPVTPGAASGSITVSATEAMSKTVPVSGTGVQGALDLSTSSLSFSATQVGQQSAAKGVMLMNSGDHSLSLGAPSVDADFVITGNTCASTLPAGQSCQVSVAFAPTAEGNRTGSLRLPNDGIGGLRTVSLSGSAQPSTATLSSPAFSSIPANSSTTAEATLTNTGVGPVSLTLTATVSGASFSLESTTCSTTLAAGASCNFTVRFSPTSGMTYNGTLSIVTSAGDKSVALTATGTRAQLSFSPASLPSFGNVQVGELKDSVAVTLSNSGNAAATALVLSAPARFSLVSSTCGTSLAAGSSCSFVVRFAPNAVQAYAGNVTASGAAHDVGASLAVSGSGVAASGSLSGLNFGSRAANTTTDLAASLTNTGVGPLTVTPPSASSVSGSGFSFVSTTCSTSLAAGGSCTITVRFSPTAAVSYSGSLSVATGAGTLTSSISGDGLQGTSTASTSSLSFGSVQVGQTSAVQTVTMTNNGNTALTFSGISVAIGEADFAQSNNCGTTLAAGSSCTVSVSFTPSTTGELDGVLVALHNGPGGRTDVGLLGTGVAQSATLTIPGHGSVLVGSTSDQTATLTNTGIGPLSVTVPSSASVAGAEFSFVSTTCGTSLSAGSTCGVVVRFTPTSNQDYTGTLSVTAGGSARTASLSGRGLRPVLSFSSAGTDFGNVQVGQTANGNSVTLTNTGNSNATSLLIITPTGFSTTSSSCGSTLAAGASCSFVPRFSPTNAQAYSGNITASAASPAVSANHAVSGTGVNASASITNVNFGSVNVGSSLDQTATLTNTGVGPVTLTAPTSASVTGTGFSFVSTTCGTTLNAGSSCSTVVRFAPAAQGAATGSLVISTSAGNRTSNLNGTGAQAVLAFTPSSIAAFGNVQVGQSKDSVSVTLANSGNVTASSLSLSAPSGYSLVSSTCGTSLNAGSSCSFIVRFSPAAAQSYSSSVTASAAAPVSGASLAVSGTGVNQSGSVSAVSFGSRNVGTSTNLTSTVTNTGAGPLSLTTPTSSSVTGAAFSFVSTTCGTSLAAGNSCTVTVRFSPTDTVAHSGSVQVSSGAGTLTGSLSGTGTGSKATATTSTNAAFGTVAYGASTPSLAVSFRNDGNSNMTLSVASPASPFAVSTNGCINIAPGVTCSIVYTASTATVGTFSGTSAITGAALGNTTVNLSITVSGSVTTATTSANYTFPITPYNAAQPTYAISLRNDGNTNMTLTTSLGNTTNFAVNSNSCTNIAPGGSCSVVVAMRTNAIGSFTSALSIAGGTTGAINSTLSGAVEGAVSTWSTTSVSLGSVNTGSSSSTTVTLTNNGNVAANFNPQTAVSGSLAGYTFSGCTAVAAGASCTMTVTFSPTAAGTYSGSAVPTNAAQYSNVLALHGTGVQPVTVALTGRSISSSSDRLTTGTSAAGAYFELLSDGRLAFRQTATNGINNSGVYAGEWLVSGTPAEYEVLGTVLSGATVQNGPFGTWSALSSTRSYGSFATRSCSSLGTTSGTTTFRLDIRKIGTTQVLASAQFSTTASATCDR